MSLSTRERAERQASMAADDKIVPNQNLRSGGMGHSVGVNRSVREAAAQKAYEREEKASPASSAIADMYLAEHKRREAEEQARHDADVASGRLRYL